MHVGAVCPGTCHVYHHARSEGMSDRMRVLEHHTKPRSAATVGLRMCRLLQSEKGTPSDKLRAALVYLLTCESLPSDPEYEQISRTLQVRQYSASSPF